MKRRSKRKPARKKWPSEAAMCQVLIDTARGDGWVAQPETAGYDLVLISPHGYIIGVEAKLRANAAVLCQAWQRSQHDKQTHATMIYAPRGEDAFGAVCTHLGLAYLEAPEPGSTRTVGMLWVSELCTRLPRRVPTKDLPILHIPSAVAGAPAPLQLTEWKLKAVKFCIENEAKAVTRKMLTAAGLSPTLWLRNWLTPCGNEVTAGKRPVKLYALKDHPGRPDKRYPEIADALRAAGATRDVKAPGEEP